MREGQLSAAEEWRSRWMLVLVSALGFSFYSILFGATGLFLDPLTKEFGWSRTLLSSGPSIASVVTAVLSPFIGALIDRYGSRRVALPGLIVTVGSISAFGLLNGTEWQWVTLWIVFGVVSGAIKSTAWTAAVLGQFKTSRGLALGLTLSGAAVAQMGVPPLVNWLIESLGWRMAFVWAAVGWGGITFLLCLFFFWDAHDRKDGSATSRADSANTPSQPSTDIPGLTTREAMADTALWRLAFSTFMVMTLTIGLMIHLFPILTEAGVSRTHAAWLLSLGGVTGIAGKLITGALLDRFRPNWVGGLTLGAAALAFLLLLDGLRSPTLILIAMLVNGYAAGTKTQIAGYLAAAYGGMRNFGAIYGVMAAMMALASGLGPLFAGVIYDLAGSYGPFLIVGTLGCTISGLLMITMPEYPVWQEIKEQNLEDGDDEPAQKYRTI